MRPARVTRHRLGMRGNEVATSGLVPRLRTAHNLTTMKTTTLNLILDLIALENREHTSAIFQLSIKPEAGTWIVELDDGMVAHRGESADLDTAAIEALIACRDEWASDAADYESDVANNIRESVARMTAVIDAGNA